MRHCSDVIGDVCRLRKDEKLSELVIGLGLCRQLENGEDARCFKLSGW